MELGSKDEMGKKSSSPCEAQNKVRQVSCNQEVSLVGGRCNWGPCRSLRTQRKVAGIWAVLPEDEQVLQAGHGMNRAQDQRIWVVFFF